MERGLNDKTILEEFTEEFVKIVEKYCKYIVVSGFVAIIHGRSRATEDIDMIIERISKEKFIELHNDLIKNEFECMQTDKPEIIYDDYLLNKTSVRYTRKGEFLPEMEIKLARDELDDLQISTRQKFLEINNEIWFSSIEMNIAFKEQFLKSDKDLEDARHLRIIYEDKISEHEINEIKKMIKKLRQNERRT